MEINNLIEVLKNSTFISAVLSGFAVTLFVSLLPDRSKRKVESFAVVSALIAAVFLIVSTITGIAGIISVSFEQDPRVGISGAFFWTAISFLIGMVSFLTSLGLSGWSRSNRFGVVCSSIAGVAILALTYFLIAVVGAF